MIVEKVQAVLITIALGYIAFEITRSTMRARKARILEIAVLTEEVRRLATYVMELAADQADWGLQDGEDEEEDPRPSPVVLDEDDFPF